MYIPDYSDSSGKMRRSVSYSKETRKWTGRGLLIGIVVLLTTVIMMLWLSVEGKGNTQDLLSLCMNDANKWYNNETTSRNYLCQSIQQQLDERISLLSDLHNLLARHNVIHFLCYGTLWAIIRQQSLLTHDRDVDLCTVDTTHSIIEQVIKDLPGTVYFVKNYTSYHIWREMGEAEITMFVKTDRVMETSMEKSVMRAGWNEWLLKQSCAIEQFPEHLIKEPLPTGTLNDKQYPVPREGFEIMMYLYPNDWSAIVKPVHCRDLTKVTADSSEKKSET